MRRKNIYFCWVLLIILLGCSTKEVHRDFFADGKLSSETQIEAGLKNGQELIYDSLGNLVESKMYVHDTLDGPSTSYYANGEVGTITTYRKGKKQGEFFSFYRNGYIAQYGHFEGDNPKGLWYDYSKTDSGKVLVESYALNAQGDVYVYYVKELSEKEEWVYIRRPVSADFKRDINLGDTVKVYVELQKNSPDFDFASLVVGDFDENFYPRGKLDTVKLENKRGVVTLLPKVRGEFYVRGVVLEVRKKNYADSAILQEVFKTPFYFEEKYSVH